MKCRFAKRALILCAALITLNPVLGDEFKNSVVNLKLNKDSNGSVNVKVITAKPYDRPIYVNEKSNNTYVILLPETQNLLTGKPILNGVSNEVSGVTINTHPYVEGGCKGYTKITIVSPKPINICATAGLNVKDQTIVIPKNYKPQQTVKPKVEQKTVAQPKPQQTVKPKVEQKPVTQPKPQQTTTTDCETKG